MPLKQGSQYEPDFNLPSNLTSKEEVYIIPFTGEIFRIYSDYVAKSRMYQSRIWSCQTTGTDHLTYQEALKSEGQDIMQLPQEWHDKVKPKLQQFSSVTIPQIQNQSTGTVFSNQEDFIAQQYLTNTDLLHKLGDFYTEYRDLLYNYQPDIDATLQALEKELQEITQYEGDEQYQETLEQVEERFKYEYEQSLNTQNRSISLKYLIFQILVEARPKGLSITEIVEQLENKKISPFLDSRQAKSGVSSTCSHDQAFFRLGPALFTLTALPEFSDQVKNAGKPKSAAYFQLEKQIQSLQQKEQQVLAKLEEMERAYLAKNIHKCSQCQKIQHEYNSPLVLCDYCTRSYHLACLEKNWNDLPLDTWACPKCQEKHIQYIKRLQELELKKKEQIERVYRQEKENQLKQNHRLSQKTVKLQQNKDKQSKHDMKLKEKDYLQNNNLSDLPASPQKTGVVTLKQFQQLFQKINSRDDFEAVKYYREYMEKLKALQSLGTYYVDQALIDELQSMVHGPEILFQNLNFNQSQVIQNALYEVIIFSHFLYSFNVECEVSFLNSAQIIDLVQLDQPSLSQYFVLDQEDDDQKHISVKKAEKLEDLYMGLLNCVLISQMEQLESTSWRAKRWARILERNEYQFQAILQRTLLTIYKGYKLSRNAMKLMDQLQVSKHQILNGLQDENLKIDFKDLSSLLVQYDVMFKLQDHEFVYYVAQIIDIYPVICLPSLVHLRLLNIMATQILNGEGLRNIIQNRHNRQNELWIEKYYKMAEARRKGQLNNPKQKQENQTKSEHNSEEEYEDDDLNSNLNSDNEDIDNQSQATHNKSHQGNDIEAIRHYNVQGVANVMGYQWIQELVRNQIRVEVLGQDRYFADYYWTPNDKQRIYRVLKYDPYKQENLQNNKVVVKQENGIVENGNLSFKEGQDKLQIGYIDTPQKLEAFLKSLSQLGQNERQLKIEIRKNFNSIMTQFQLQQSLLNLNSDNAMVDNNLISEKQLQELIQDPIQRTHDKTQNKQTNQLQAREKFDNIVETLHSHMIASCIENVKENITNFIEEYQKNQVQDDYWEIHFDTSKINLNPNSNTKSEQNSNLHDPINNQSQFRHDMNQLIDSIKYIEEHLNFVSLNSYRKYYQNRPPQEHANQQDQQIQEEENNIEDQLQQDEKQKGTGVKFESNYNDDDLYDDSANIITIQKRQYNIQNVLEKELEEYLDLDFDDRIAPYQELIDSDEEDQPLIQKDKRYIDKQRTKLNHIVEYYLRNYEFDKHYLEYQNSDKYKQLQEQYQEQQKGLQTEQQIVQDQEQAIKEANNFLSLPTNNNLIGKNVQPQQQIQQSQEPQSQQPQQQSEPDAVKQEDKVQQQVDDQNIKQEDDVKKEDQKETTEDQQRELKIILFQMLSLWRNQLERKFWYDKIDENLSSNRFLNLCYYIECFIDRAFHYTRQLQQRIQYKDRSIQNRLKEIHQYQTYLLQHMIKQKNKLLKKRQDQLRDQVKYDLNFDEDQQRRTRDSNKNKQYTMFDKLDMIPDSEEPDDLARAARRLRRQGNPPPITYREHRPMRAHVKRDSSGRFLKSSPGLYTSLNKSGAIPTRRSTRANKGQVGTQQMSNQYVIQSENDDEFTDSSYSSVIERPQRTVKEQKDDVIQSDDDEFELDQFSEESQDEVAKEQDASEEAAPEMEQESSDEYQTPSRNRRQPSGRSTRNPQKSVNLPQQKQQANGRNPQRGTRKATYREDETSQEEDQEPQQKKQPTRRVGRPKGSIRKATRQSNESSQEFKVPGRNLRRSTRESGKEVKESSEESQGPSRNLRRSTRDKMLIDKKVWDDIENESESESEQQSSDLESEESQDKSSQSNQIQINKNLETRQVSINQQPPPKPEPARRGPPVTIQQSKPQTRKYEIFELGQKSEPSQAKKKFRI